MIWFIDDDAGSPLHGMEFRHYYMAQALKENSTNSLIISASYSHLFYKTPTMKDEGYLLEKINGLDYLWIKVLNYKKGNSKKRILKWFQFAFKLLFVPQVTESKPTVIVSSCNAPFLIFPCYYLAKRYNAKLVVQVKDIWPLTLMELGGYSKYNPLIYLMQKSANFSFKHADMVVSVLPYLHSYLEEQGIENINVQYLPNGISVEEIEHKKVPLNHQSMSNIPSNKFILGYAGAMGVGDGLDILLHMAYRLKAYKMIHIVLVGQGAYKKALENIAKNLQLDNVTFLEPIPKGEVHSLLKHFNACYIGWQDKKIYNYGISANKIFDYMYAKKPILHLYSGEGDLISEAECGITVTQQSDKLLAQALLKLYNMSTQQRESLGNKGYLYVKKHHSYRAISHKFLAICQENFFLFDNRRIAIQ